MPYLKELEKKLEGKNICFLSISCDKDVEKWKQMMKDEELGGIHAVSYTHLLEQVNRKIAESDGTELHSDSGTLVYTANA